MTSNKNSPKGNYKGRHLPHFDHNGLYQMITYRLNDSLPKNVITKIISENKDEKDSNTRASIEKTLDVGYGSCILQQPQIASMVIENWHHFDKKKYALIAYVVMPNHVHVLIKTINTFSLKSILHSWKSYTSSQFKKHVTVANNQLISVPGWQRDYWDRYIRDENHFISAIYYIHSNPVKAGLCKEECDWPNSSFSLQ